MLKKYYFSMDSHPTIKTFYSHVGNVDRTNYADEVIAENTVKELENPELTGQAQTIFVHKCDPIKRVLRNYKQCLQLKMKINGIIWARSKESAEFYLFHKSRGDYFGWNTSTNIKVRRTEQ